MLASLTVASSKLKVKDDVVTNDPQSMAGQVTVNVTPFSLPPDAKGGEGIRTAA